jgi:LL-H family phage holin
MELQAEIINIIASILLVFAGFITKQITGYLKEKGLIKKLEKNKELVKIVVNAVEQTSKHFNGEEKLNVAKLELVKLMNEKKIKISEKEMDLLIESVVKEMKDTVKEEISK